MSESPRHDRRKSDSQLAVLGERVEGLKFSLDALRLNVETIERMLRNGDGYGARIKAVEDWKRQVMSWHAWAIRACVGGAITLLAAGVVGAAVWLVKQGAFG